MSLSDSNLVARNLVDVWAAAVVTNGGTVSTGRKATVRTLMLALINDGIWNKLDRLWLLAAENSASALTDVRTCNLATLGGTGSPDTVPTFTTDRGFAGDGSADFINTNFTLSTAGNYALNSAHIGGWVETANLVNSTAPFRVISGSDSAGILYQTTGGWRGQINDTAFIDSSSTAAGHILVSRTGASARAIFVNGASANSDSTTSSATPALNLFVLATNSAGPGNYSTDRIAAVHIGSGFSGSEVSNFYTRLRAYMTAVGVP